MPGLKTFLPVVDRLVDDVHGLRDDGQFLAGACAKEAVDELVEPVDDLTEELRSFFGEGNPHVPAVVRVVGADEVSALDELVDEEGGARGGESGDGHDAAEVAWHGEPDDHELVELAPLDFVGVFLPVLFEEGAVLAFEQADHLLERLEIGRGLRKRRHGIGAPGLFDAVPFHHFISW